MKRIVHQKNPLRILLLTNGIILIAGAMLGPIYALFVKDIGGDLLDAGFAFAVYSVAAGITTFISSYYSDRICENEFIIILGYGLMALGFFGYIFVHSVFELLFVQVIIGMGEAIYLPAFDSLYSKYLSDDKAGLQWGMWETMNYFTGAFGAVTGGVLVSHFSFQTLFVVMGLMSLGSAIYIFLLPREVL